MSPRRCLVKVRDLKEVKSSSCVGIQQAGSTVTQVVGALKIGVQGIAARISTRYMSQ